MGGLPYSVTGEDIAEIFSAHGTVESARVIEHLGIAGETKWYETIEHMQKDLDEFLVSCSSCRAHEGLAMNGTTPYQVFQAGLAALEQTEEATPPVAAKREPWGGLGVGSIPSLYKWLTLLERCLTTGGSS